jgi:hypothetical protein
MEVDKRKHLFAPWVVSRVVSDHYRFCGALKAANAEDKDTYAILDIARRL